MNYFNNNTQNQLGFIDLLSIASFVIGVMNLNENVTQSDKQELIHELSNKSDLLLKQIHGHLQAQDNKLNDIIERLDRIENDNRRDFQKPSQSYEKRNDVTLGAS